MPHPGRRHLPALLGAAALAQSAPPDPALDPLQQVRTVATQPAVADGMPIIVVDEHGDAVPGALVAVIDVLAETIGPQRMRAITSAMTRHVGDELRQAAIVMTQMGTCYRAGADGSVRVRLPQDRPFVAIKALHGEQLAETLIADDATSTRLVLLASRQVTVTVVDAADRPVSGMPIGLFAKGQTVAVHEAITDSLGNAILREPRFLRRSGTPVEAGLAMPLAADVRGRVSWRSYTPTTVTLRAPAFGHVIVRGDRVWLSDQERDQLWRGIHTDAAGTHFVVGLGIALLALATDPQGRELNTAVRPLMRVGDIVIVDPATTPRR